VEPITHGLASLALARASQGRLPRFGTSLFVASGMAADLDYLSYFAGPAAFLRLHRGLLHSLLGSGALVGVIAAGFYFFDRRRPAATAGAGPPLSFRAAAAVCTFGAAWHLALDFCAGDSVQLFWPFKVDASAWNFAANLDPWILVLLSAGLLLPLLFRLVSEEIGERKKRYVGRRGALATLVLLVMYLGARGVLHSRATETLGSRSYHRRTPLATGAYPSATVPFDWRGLVTTDNTIEEVEISLAPGAEFDPDRSLTHYKPDDSPALEAGERSASALEFLRYAQFPIASVSRLEDGYRFEVHDLRFAADDRGPSNIFVRVDFNSDLKIREEGFRFASRLNP
jgi:membrane-bound metal-dependent hydrolase YbcI (DUF457 family)